MENKALVFAPMTVKPTLLEIGSMHAPARDSNFKSTGLKAGTGSPK
jgi:hypothetical protein